MKACFEGTVLMGGFLALAAVVYYAISKLGDVLDHIDAYWGTEPAPRAGQSHLNIGAANLWAMRRGSQAVKEMKARHPDLYCTVSVGEESELLHALSAGDVDLVILPSRPDGGREVRQREIALQAQPFINEDGVTVTPIHPAAESQFVAWKEGDSRPFLVEYVETLCGREA